MINDKIQKSILVNYYTILPSTTPKEMINRRIHHCKYYIVKRRDTLGIFVVKRVQKKTQKHI